MEIHTDSYSHGIAACERPEMTEPSKGPWWILCLCVSEHQLRKGKCLALVLREGACLIFRRKISLTVFQHVARKRNSWCTLLIKSSKVTVLFRVAQFCHCLHLSPSSILYRKFFQLNTETQVVKTINISLCQLLLFLVLLFSFCVC